MSSATTVFQCTMCNHAPFDTKAKLNKHSSSKHRKAASFDFGGSSFPLLVTDDNKYVCPTCKAEKSSVSGLRRHMGSQNCRMNHVIAAPTCPYQPEDGASQHGGMTGTIKDPGTMADLGFTIEDTWKVAICKHCHFIVDKSMIIDHLKSIHGLGIPNVNAVLLVLRMYHLRIHLAVIWDDIMEDQLDDSDDEDRGPSFFNPPAFRPGLAALQGIPVHDGFKCQLCEQRLHHVCTITKKGMRTHYSRHHRGQTVEYHPAKVQAFYGRSKIASQLRYVEVMDEEDEGQDSITAFGIPEDIHSVPNHNSNITAKRDLNQFGVKFQVYPLLETLDLSDLGPLLYSPQDRSFELLKHLCLKMFTVTREDTRAGFQPMLGKVMVGERDKDYFYEVQEKATLENYATIWAKVLWVGCLAVTNTGRLHEGLELTDEQTVGATGLVQDLELLKGARENDDSALQSSALVTVVMFSTHILRQQFEVVNHILPTGKSLALQYLVPRALSLLSLRPNGSFLSYLQISHVTAAMRYALRSTVLYRVARSTKPLLLTEDDIDDECARFLAPQKSTSFSYCVQVHAACRRFGQKNQVPTITWATDNFSALRLQSGSILTIGSLKSFIQEQYKAAEENWATGRLVHSNEPHG